MGRFRDVHGMDKIAKTRPCSFRSSIRHLSSPVEWSLRSDSCPASASAITAQAPTQEPQSTYKHPSQMLLQNVFHFSIFNKI
ncbi:hypothetical protein ANANG_G00111230 [Anguilla anguilla]|uniref:Uncharacterized protein n=1 Tax=Anguilla anguilla TaxID=7936 RepID=A0A9D3MKG4_ANGAN|nr:hypothetical protein ANANG_G00111230 [Anguilla anguilla]